MKFHGSGLDCLAFPRTLLPSIYYAGQKNHIYDFSLQSSRQIGRNVLMAHYVGTDMYPGQFLLPVPAYSSVAVRGFNEPEGVADESRDQRD
jgi:hypothetical protein